MHKYLLMCIWITKKALEGNIPETLIQKGLFFERTKLYSITLELSIFGTISLVITSSVTSCGTAEYCHYFNKYQIIACMYLNTEFEQICILLAVHMCV